MFRLTVSVLVSCRRGLWHTGILGETWHHLWKVESPGLALSAPADRVLTGLLGEGIVGRVSRGVSHLPASQRYHLTPNGTSKGAEIPGVETPWGFEPPCPSPGSSRRYSSAEWMRRAPSSKSPPRCLPASTGHAATWSSTTGGRSDATIARQDGRTFGAGRPRPDPAATVKLLSAESRNGVRQDASS